MSSEFRCIECGRRYAPSFALRCVCGGLLEVEHKLEAVDRSLFDRRLSSSQSPYDSGVWRFKELVHPDIGPAHIISRSEGNTRLYAPGLVSDYVGVSRLLLKHEGENPTGSFKDRGMTAGVSEAVRLGAKVVACASTGNTAASMAAYAAQAGLSFAVLIPEGEVPYGKLAQALAYGARVLQVRGSFDDAMRFVQRASEEMGLYLLNSVNPWRIEGQKTIVFELLQQLGWKTPDWIVFPAGNLGNTAAFGKALMELKGLGLISSMPRLAAIQAEGANPFHRLWRKGGSSLEPVEKPKTIASAIKIGSPVNWRKALRAIEGTNGLVDSVSDQEIMDAKALVDRTGVGCEPASAASVAGVKRLVEAGVVDRGEEVVCILTGNLLKDPESTIRYHTGRLEGISPRFAKGITVIEPDLASAEEALERLLSETSAQPAAGLERRNEE